MKYVGTNSEVDSSKCLEKDEFINETPLIFTS